MKRGIMLSLLFMFAIASMSTFATQSKSDPPGKTAAFSILLPTADVQMVSTVSIEPVSIMDASEAPLTVDQDDPCYCGYKYANGSYCRKSIPCYLGTRCAEHGFIIAGDAGGNLYEDQCPDVVPLK